jgi:hypothetical protein
LHRAGSHSILIAEGELHLFSLQTPPIPILVVSLRLATATPLYGLFPHAAGSVATRRLMACYCSRQTSSWKPIGARIGHCKSAPWPGHRAQGEENGHSIQLANDVQAGSAPHRHCPCGPLVPVYVFRVGSAVRAAYALNACVSQSVHDG